MGRGLIAALGLLALALPAQGGGAGFSPAQRRHWAWKKPVRPPLPVVRDAGWARSPVDRFVLARLERAGLRPAPQASPEQSIRRVAFGLTGLPPTPEEIDRFLADRAPGGYERMVDRYLEAPAYGERWARHWLDLARYADTNGYEHDEIRPDAWRYRDYVVQALNEDRPYDRFVQEQLAGDELFPQRPEAAVATGWNLLGPDMTDAADQAVRRYLTLSDMTDTAGLAFLGLTMGCARCHDHKYEPLTQRDYFRMQAFFSPARFRADLPLAGAEERERHARATAEVEARLRALRTEVEAVGGSVRERLREEKLERLPEDVQTAFRLPENRRTADQQNLVRAHTRRVEPSAEEIASALERSARDRFRSLQESMRRVDASRPAPLPAAMGLTNGDLNAPTYLLDRGELSGRGERVEPGFPEILGTSATAVSGPGPRTRLARWVTSPDHPLTARVLVNRVWQHHFGRGIVATPSDFGVRGADPTHPELLDWLAVHFTAPHGKSPGSPPELPSGLGWSLKRLHRLLLTSAAYRQSTQPSAAALRGDPENRLFSRQNRARLEAEAVRDAVLAVSGRLDRHMGGPGVQTAAPEPRARQSAGRAASEPSGSTRRSLYLFVRRNLPHPMLEVLDAPDTNLSCPAREVSTTAPQALALLNDPEMLLSARRLAGRACREAVTMGGRLERLYRLTLGRLPTRSERVLAEQFLARQERLLGGRSDLALPDPPPPGVAPAAAAALTDLSLALLNLNEFLYVD